MQVLIYLEQSFIKYNNKPGKNYCDDFDIVLVESLSILTCIVIYLYIIYIT